MGKVAGEARVIVRDGENQRRLHRTGSGVVQARAQGANRLVGQLADLIAGQFSNADHAAWQERRIDAPPQGYQDIIGGPFRRHDKDQQTRRRSPIQVLRRDKLSVEHDFETCQNTVQVGQRGTPSTELDHVGTPPE